MRTSMYSGFEFVSRGNNSDSDSDDSDPERKKMQGKLSGFDPICCYPPVALRLSLPSMV